MTPSAPADEDEMQRLVAEHPEVIADDDGDLLLIRREQTVTDGEAGGNRWSLDHLFVTRDGVPVLVELKRAVDTRLRREVVGQLLDYAANGSAYWQDGDIARSFARTAHELGLEEDAALSGFIGDADPQAFWAQVDSNLKAGRIKLVFVADQIPRELARVVEFLNDQMRADVRAVELRWFSDGRGVTTLAPRIIGQTERAAVAKSASSAPLPRIERDIWLQERIAPLGPEALSGARAYVRLVEQAGGRASVAARHGSIYALFQDASGKIFYPLHLWGHDGTVSFSLRWLHARPSLQDEAVRREWLDRFEQIMGPLNTANLTGFPAGKVAVLADPERADALKSWLTDFAAHVIEPTSGA